MDTEELLRRILKEETTGLPIAYWEYSGKKAEYMTYNEEDERPVLYAENEPGIQVTWWQVHIFAPKKFNYKGYKRNVEKILTQNGFLVTDKIYTYEPDTKTMHVIIKCWKEEGEEHIWQKQV